MSDLDALERRVDEREALAARRAHCPTQKYDIFAGRRATSKWACPFMLPRAYKEKPQARVAHRDAYRRWITGQPQLLAALPELRGKTIGCDCAPGLACHVDVLVELVLKGIE